MSPLVHLLERGDGHVGVARRGREMGVAQDLLHMPQVGPVLQQERRHGVPEDVAAALLAEAGRTHVVVYPLGQAVGAEASTSAGEEEDPGIGRHHEARPGIVQVAVVPRERPRPDRHRELMGLKAPTEKTPPKTARLRKRLQKVEELPAADQRTVLKLVEALHESRRRTARPPRSRAAS